MWLRAVGENMDPQNSQGWRHPRAGRRCLAWDAWICRFLQDHDWVRCASDRAAWRRLLPFFVSFVLSALHVHVPLQGQLHLHREGFSLLAPASDVAILNACVDAIRRPLNPIRLTLFVVGDSADVARWVAGEAQLATPHMSRLLHVVLDSLLYLHQSGLEFRDFHHAAGTRLVSHLRGITPLLMPWLTLVLMDIPSNSLIGLPSGPLGALATSCSLLMVPPAAILLVTLGLAVLFGSPLLCLMVRMLLGAVMFRLEPIWGCCPTTRLRCTLFSWPLFCSSSSCQLSEGATSSAKLSPV